MDPKTPRGSGTWRAIGSSGIWVHRCETDKQTGVVLSTLEGRADARAIQTLCDGWRTQSAFAPAGGSVWIIDATKVEGYAAEAVRAAVVHFGELADASRQVGIAPLRLMVATITSTLVVMGARVVSASLAAAGSTLRIEVCDTLENARAAAQRALGPTIPPKP